jgi:hypothetical protein
MLAVACGAMFEDACTSSSLARDGGSPDAPTNASGRDAAVDASQTDSPMDVPNVVCPGHIDPSGGPILAIRTSDGVPSINSLKLDSRVCQGYYTSQPDADSGPGGYGEFRLYMRSGLFLESAVPVGAEPAPCVFEVVSIYGTSVKLTATVYYQHRTTKHCYMNSDCCDPAGIEWLGSVRFSPEVQPVTFPPGPDASVDAPQTDATLDSPLAADALID